MNLREIFQFELERQKRHLRGPFSPERISGGMFRAVHEVVNVLFVTALCLLMAFGAYAVWDTYAVVEHSLPTHYDIYRPKPDSPTFDELKAKNPDVIGWLNIYGTNIDYPVLQGKDNFEYLNLDAERNSAMTGSIYIDAYNKPDFSDFNTIIYGHHMEYHVMFGDIDLFRDRTFFKNHRFGSLFFNGKEHGLEIFSYLTCPSSDPVIYAPGVTEPEAKNTLLNKLKKDAVYYRKLNVTQHDHIVVMSTCMPDVTEGRYILTARITDETFKNPFGDEVHKGKLSGVDKVKTIFDLIPLHMWILLIFLLAMAVGRIRELYHRAEDKVYGTVSPERGRIGETATK